MAIRFPKMHIAKSAANRILNIADEIDLKTLPLPTIDVPSTPASDPKGAAIDVAVNTPPDPVAAPPGVEAQDVLGPDSFL